jgi:hypothetical protein
VAEVLIGRLQIALFASNCGDDSFALRRHIMRASLRAGRLSVLRARDLLSERELAVVNSVDLYRYLTTRQIESLHFYDHASPLTGARTCRRVLERLSRDGLLWRLDRRIGGVRAGSASYVYGLGLMGHRVLHQGQEARSRKREPSTEFLDHTLAVSQLAVDLHEKEREGAIRVHHIDPEPHCWRTFSRGLEGAETLRPDLYAVLSSEGYEYHWFVEVDLSTHSAASVVRKCQLYQSYWQTGTEQDQHGLFPKVLWTAPTQRRVDLLRRVISATQSLNQDLFEICAAEHATHHLTGGKP